ncbi:MAG: 4'-phosphopantetheinyl transferase superfamily protein [Candidatus Levybacteria bacterium]|nr:4'-phosphopantetheinyl transferase superfamily protein [Candidatus Levybacteria bacterium]
MLGIDIVYLPEFEARMKNVSLEKVFLQVELSQNKTSENLAGIFAAKEAFFKALGKKANWLDVWIEKNKFGMPSLHSNIVNPSYNMEVSISHKNKYAISVVFIWKH